MNKVISLGLALLLSLGSINSLSQGISLTANASEIIEDSNAELSEISDLTAVEISSDSTKISWSATSDVISYSVYIKAEGDDDFQLYCSTAETNAVISSLDSTKAYNIYISGQDIDFNEIALSEVINVTTLAYVPKDIQNFTTEAITSSYINISWSAVSTATRYEIYYCDTARITFKLLKSTTATTARLSNLTANKSYLIYIKGYDVTGKQVAVSPTICGHTSKAMQISNLQAAQQTQSYINIKWSAFRGARFYKIYYTTDTSSSFIFLKQVSATSARISNLKDSQNYKLYIEGYGSAENLIAKSDTIYARTKASSSSLIRNLSVTQATSSYININWNSYSNANKYGIYYRQAENGKFNLYKSTTATSARLTNLIGNVTYEIYIVGYNKNGTQISSSNSIIAYKNLTTPNVSISSDARTLTINFGNAVTNGGYQIVGSTNKSSGYKTIAIEKNGEAFKTLTNLDLTAGKTYYFRVRKYIKLNGITYYGSYSQILSASIAKSKITINSNNYVGKSFKVLASTKIQQSASWSSSAVTTISKGQTVKVTAVSGRWFKVSYNGYTGYLYNLALINGTNVTTVTSSNYNIAIDDILFSVGNTPGYCYKYIAKSINTITASSKSMEKGTVYALKYMKGSTEYKYSLLKKMIARCGYSTTLISGTSKTSGNAYCFLAFKLVDKTWRYIDLNTGHYQYKVTRDVMLKVCRWNEAKSPSAFDSANNELYGKKIAVLGDSFSSGYGILENPMGHVWQQYLADRNGMTVENHTKSGLPISGDEGFNVLYKSISKDVDYIILMAGANDRNKFFPIGTNSDYTNKTFKGSLNILIDGLRKEYPNAKICYMTFIKRGLTQELSYFQAEQEIFNLKGVTYRDNYSDADFDFSKNSPYLYRYDVGYQTTGVLNRHFTPEAYELLSYRVEKFLRDSF